MCVRCCDENEAKERCWQKGKEDAMISPVIQLVAVGFGEGTVCARS